MTKEEKAIYDFVNFMYRQTGYNHWSVITMLYSLVVNKMTKLELLQMNVSENCEEVCKLKEKAFQIDDKSKWCAFVEKYWTALKMDDFPNTQESFNDTKAELENKEYKPYSDKIPVESIYWVIKRRQKYISNYKRYKYSLMNPLCNYTPQEWREMFIKSTTWTQQFRGRKQSKRYTVSRDEDRDVFYTSLEGRLAKLPLYKYKKYVKQGKIDKSGCRRAVVTIDDGQYVKIGRYIEKNYQHWPKQTKEALQSAFEEIKPCHMVIDTDFKKAYDPYYSCHQDTDGDAASNYSCMSGEGDRAQDFYGGIHGCKVVRWETDDGKQVGRCIMYEYNGRRHFIRIYGLYDYHRSMINLLKNEMNQGDLFGRNERIDGLELETDWNDETPSMYLDGNRYGIRHDTVWNGNKLEVDKWVVSTRYDNDCKVTDHEEIQYLGDEDVYTCECCGETVSTDEGWWIGDHFYCSTSCANECGWYECTRCGEWEHEDDGVWTDDGDFYCCRECAENDGFRECQSCGKWEHEDDMIETQDGCWFCNEDCADDCGWKSCYHCGDWFKEDSEDAVHTNDGYYCCADCAERDGWVKVGEEWKREEDVEVVKEQEQTEEPKEVANEG